MVSCHLIDVVICNSIFPYKCQVVLIEIRHTVEGYGILAMS